MILNLAIRTSLTCVSCFQRCSRGLSLETGQIPSYALTSSGGGDGGYYVTIHLTPFEKRSVIHTINFYAHKFVLLSKYCCWVSRYVSHMPHKRVCLVNLAVVESYFIKCEAVPWKLHIPNIHLLSQTLLLHSGFTSWMPWMNQPPSSRSLTYWKLVELWMDTTR